MKNHKMSRFILGFVKVTGYLPAIIFFKPKIYLLNDSCHRGLRHPSILMSNHTSLLDFVLYLIIFPFTSIRFLMAEVLYNKGRLFSWFLDKIGGIKVNRDVHDFEFVAESLETLDKKGIIGIFPQGRLPVDGNIFPFKSGITFIASKTDAPIVPVYTDGSYGLFKRARVMIGEEIYIGDMLTSANPTPDELESITRLLQDRTFQLKDELEKRIKSHEKSRKDI